jgi:hypothetical protein
VVAPLISVSLQKDPMSAMPGMHHAMMMDSSPASICAILAGELSIIMAWCMPGMALIGSFCRETEITIWR